MTALKALCVLMEHLLLQHQQLLALENKKQEAILKNKLDELTSINHHETRLLAHIISIEEKREGVIKAFINAKALVSSDGTLSGLYPYMEESADKEHLQLLHQKLLDVIKTLDHRSDLNQKLLKQSIEYVNVSLDYITAPPEDDLFYHKTQHVPHTNKTGGKLFFDKKT